MNYADENVQPVKGQKKIKEAKKTFKSFVSASYQHSHEDPKYRFMVYVVYTRSKGAIGVRRVACGAKEDPTCEEVTEQFYTVARKRHTDMFLDNDKANAVSLQQMENRGGLFSSKLWESNLLWGQAGTLERNLGELQKKLEAIKQIDY